MNSKTTGAIIIVSLLGIVVAVMPGCAGRSAAKSAPPAPPEVTVAHPVVQKITDYFEFPGQTAAVGEVEVRARVTGYLVKVNFQDGQLVKKGHLLYEIDPRPYQAALERERGDLARLLALQSKAKVDLARSKRLRPSGAVSEDEYELREANLAVHTASIQSAKAAIRDAELNLEFTRITAPIDGRVSRTRITEGNLIQVGTADSAVLTTVVTTNPIYVYFSMDEQALLKYEELAAKTGRQIHPGSLKELNYPVEIGLANEEGFPHAGVLDFADNRVDRTTGTLRIRGVFNNKDDLLTPGLFVRVRIAFGKPHDAIMVPERSIGRDQREKVVFVVDKENKVKSRKVKVGSLHDGLRVIESGIAADDLIITNGLLRARAGEAVSPQFETEKEATPPSTAENAGKPADKTPPAK